jgi:hypothetical protein
MPTSYEDMCAILSDLWINYRDSEELAEFFSYADIGLPMAYLVHTKLVTANDSGVPYIEEAFDSFCQATNNDSDGNYKSLGDLIQILDDDED